MKYYIYYDQLGEHILSEKQIILEYWDYWTTKMLSVGRSNLINREHCIEDFCIIH